MGQFWHVLHGLKPVMFMVAVQIAGAINNVLYKLVVVDGMDLKVLVAYRLLFATAFMLPLALLLERKGRPNLTWMILFQAFLCGLFGGLLPLNFYVKALALTSATFATAMSNLSPVITFVLSLSFGLEKLKLGTQSGKAKLLGTCMGISGAMVLTFYKGPEINIWSTNVNLVKLFDKNVDDTKMSPPPSHSPNPVLGALLSLGASFSYALWLIVQTKMSKRYPCHYSSTALMCAMGTVQAVIFAVCMDRNWSEWKIFDKTIRLSTALYSGIVAYGLTVVLISWCALEKGPIYVSNFIPLSAVIVTIAASLLLDEQLYLGSFIGAILIIGGLYTMLWGRSKEIQEMKKVNEGPNIASKSSQDLELSEITTTNSVITADHHGMIPSTVGNNINGDSDNNYVVELDTTNTGGHKQNDS